MTEQRIRYLFDRYFTDRCTEAERLEFLQLTEGGAYDEELLQVMEECWARYGGRKRGRGRRQLMAAAALVLVCVTGVFLFTRKDISKSIAVVVPVAHDVAPGGKRAVLTLTGGQQIVLDSAADGRLAQQGNVRIMKLADGKLDYHGGDEEDGLRFNTISTPNGGQYQVTLTDGTRVWLNAASTLTYPTAFRGHQREVRLQGEAYFEVVHNAGQPFVVSVGDMKVDVLGTDLNIMAYAEEGAIRTTLLSGKVKVAEKLLAPGEQASWENGKVVVDRDADVEAAVAWKNGMLQFNSAGIRTVMRQIARWYDVEVVYDGDIKDEHFSGSIPSNERVSAVLKMLEMTNTVRFEVEGHRITVRSK